MSSPLPPSPPIPHPPTIDAIAALLHQLTLPDTTQVRHAEKALQQLLRHPDSITPLSQILCSNPSPALRQLSSVVLRRALPRHWGKLDATTRIAIKGALLPRLTAETDSGPRRGLFYLTAAICRVEDALWPELTALAMQLSTAEDHVSRTSAFTILHSLEEAVPLQIVPHVRDLVPMFTRGLEDPVPEVRVAALKAYEAVLGPASVQEDGSFVAMCELVPKVVAVATAHEDTQSDEFGRVACFVFDVLTLVVEIPGPRMKEFFQDAIKFALSMLVSNEAAQVARSSAVEFLMGGAEGKPKTMRNRGLVPLAVHSSCQVVYDNKEFAGNAEAFSNEDDDTEEDEVFAIHLALRLLDTLAKRPEMSKTVFLEVMAIVSCAFDQAAGAEKDIREQTFTAGYRIIGSIARGCSAEVTVHVQEVVKKLVDGAMSADSGFERRGRAIQALGFVCEALDTEEIPDEVTADIADAGLSAVLVGMRHPEIFVKRHACMALEPIVTLFKDENSALRGKVHEVMEALGGLGNDVAKEAVWAIGVLAEHATEAFGSSPMYRDVVQGITRLMVLDKEEDMLSRVAALDAAGALVSACKDQSVIETLAKHAILCLDEDDPTVMFATYSFFARMADAVGGSVVFVFGVKMLTYAIRSIEREDVVFVPENGFGGQNIGNGFGSEEDEEGNVPGSYQVRTAYLDEKMVAIECVGAFGAATASDEYLERISTSIETANAIRDLLTRALSLIDDLITYFHEEVRAAAHRAHSRMAGANLDHLKRHPALAFGGQEFVGEAFAKLVHGMQEDDDMWVVTNVLNATSTFLRQVFPDQVAKHKTDVVDSVRLLLAGQAACQMTADDDSTDGAVADDEENVGDEIGALIEAVGDVIEALAHSLRGYFAQDFPPLLEKMFENLYMKQGSPRNKGMILGAVAGVMLFMNWDRCTIFPPPGRGTPQYELPLTASDNVGALLLPHALTAIQSAGSKTLQRNAVFLTGIIFARTRASRTEVWQLLPQALRVFQDILANGQNVNGALVDNAAGAVARIAIAPGLPEGALGDHRVVLRAILGPVPLQDDPTENTTIARALLHISKSHFDDLLAEGVHQKVLSCLVSAGLLFHETQTTEKRPYQDDLQDADPNDKMTQLEKHEFWEVASLLNRLRQNLGDRPFEKMALTPEDGTVLGQILQNAAS